MQPEKLKTMNAIFYPRSVAVVGVADHPDKLGFNQLESIIMGGFKGSIYPVHPRLDSILGHRVYRSLADIPDKVDLAVIGVNRQSTLKVLEECGKIGVKGAVCIAGGYREFGDEGKDLEERLVKLALRYNIGVVGPNTLGMLNTASSLNTTFYPMKLKPGKVSFICQSGGIGLTLINKAADEGMDICKYVAVGNRSLLNMSDYLEYMAQDKDTKVIGLCIEGVEDAGRLARLAGEVSRVKPVVVYKAARTREAGQSALTHTGSMGGSYSMYRDIFSQFGVLVVENNLEMVAACKALAISAPARGTRVGVVTHTAGPSIALLDNLFSRGCQTPPLTPDTISNIMKDFGKDLIVILKNPLDTAGVGMQQEPFGRLCLNVIIDPGIDMLIPIYCLHRHWRFPSEEILAAARLSGKPVVALYLSTLEGCRQDQAYLQPRGIPVYTTPEEAAWGVAALAHYRVGGNS